MAFPVKFNEVHNISKKCSKIKMCSNLKIPRTKEKIKKLATRASCTFPLNLKQNNLDHIYKCSTTKMYGTS